MGLEMDKVYEVIKVSAGDSFIFRRVFKQMASREYTRGWQSYLIHKDLGLVLKTAERLNIPLPNTALAHQLYKALTQSGYEKIDSASVVEVLRKMTSGR